MSQTLSSRSLLGSGRLQTRGGPGTAPLLPEAARRGDARESAELLPDLPGHAERGHGRTGRRRRGPGGGPYEQAMSCHMDVWEVTSVKGPWMQVWRSIRIPVP